MPTSGPTPADTELWLIQPDGSVLETTGRHSATEATWQTADGRWYKEQDPDLYYTREEAYAEAIVRSRNQINECAAQLAAAQSLYTRLHHESEEIQAWIINHDGDIVPTTLRPTGDPNWLMAMDQRHAIFPRVCNYWHVDRDQLIANALNDAQIKLLAAQQQLQDGAKELENYTRLAAMLQAAGQHLDLPDNVCHHRGLCPECNEPAPLVGPPCCTVRPLCNDCWCKKHDVSSWLDPSSGDPATTAPPPAFSDPMQHRYKDLFRANTYLTPLHQADLTLLEQHVAADGLSLLTWQTHYLLMLRELNAAATETISWQSGRPARPGSSRSQGWTTA